MAKGRLVVVRLASWAGFRVITAGFVCCCSAPVG
jgi:hypothetical protein